MTKNKWLVPLLGVITVAALAVAVWAVCFRRPAPVLAPDYAPVETEENAQPMEEEPQEKMEASSGGGAVSLTYSDQVTVDLSDKTASLVFANPGRSVQDMMVQILVDDTVIVQSGTLEPGMMVNTLNLLDGAEKQLRPGGYDGKFAIYYYDPDNGEKAVVNTEIPVTVTVQD